MSNSNIPEKCNGCGQPLLLENLFVDDGCPCNNARGVNLKPKPCEICRVEDCVKPGHRLPELFGFPGEQLGSPACAVSLENDPEIVAIRKIVEALVRLENAGSVKRVLSYLRSRYLDEPAS
jgi:hypothetical protein